MSNLTKTVTTKSDGQFNSLEELHTTYTSEGIPLRKLWPVFLFLLCLKFIS